MFVVDSCDLTCLLLEYYGSTLKILIFFFSSVLSLTKKVPQEILHIRMVFFIIFWSVLSITGQQRANSLTTAQIKPYLSKFKQIIHLYRNAQDREYCFFLFLDIPLQIIIKKINRKSSCLFVQAVTFEPGKGELFWYMESKCKT